MGSGGSIPLVAIINILFKKATLTRSLLPTWSVPVCCNPHHGIVLQMLACTTSMVTGFAGSPGLPSLSQWTQGPRPQRGMWQICDHQTLHWFRPCHWLAEGRDYSPREALVHLSYQRGYWDPQTRHCSSGHRLFHQQHMASDPTIHQHSHPTVYWHASTNRQLTHSRQLTHIRHPTHTQYHDGSQSKHITPQW